MENEAGDKARQIEVLRLVTEALDRLGIRYGIGGSIASSAYGTPRFTYGADLSVEPFPAKAAEFLRTLSDFFYVSEEAMKEALRRKSSFNLIHYDSGFKADLFVLKDDRFEQRLLSRTRRLPISGAFRAEFDVLFPEDVILLKLRWYECTGRASERQWEDVLSVLNVQRDRLDYEYLSAWSGILEVSALLAEALKETKSN